MNRISTMGNKVYTGPLSYINTFNKPLPVRGFIFNGHPCTKVYALPYYTGTASLTLKTFYMITSPGIMSTLSYVMEKLRLKRHDNEFIIAPEGFTIGNGKFYSPEDLTIIKTYRFEGASDPSDASILYLIESKDGLIGYSIDAYGAYSNHDDDGYDDFIRKIKVEDRDEQQIFE